MRALWSFLIMTTVVVSGCAGGGARPTPTPPAKPPATSVVSGPGTPVTSPVPAASPAASPAAVPSPGVPKPAAPPSPAASPAAAASPSPGPTLRARAELKDAQGRVVAEATLSQAGSEPVRLEVSVTSRDPQGALAPGRYGIHLHEAGRCEPPAFTTAGGHFNPGGKKHGFENPEGAHAGDLPNLEVGTGGGSLLVTNDRVTLSPGPASLLDADGSAIVIHAREDDYRTDPAGASGDRIACGEIRRA